MSTKIAAIPDRSLPLGDESCAATRSVALGTLTRIRPTSGWVGLDVRELWRYRELLVTLLWRDVTVRYKQTALGALWAILQPLLMMAIFTAVMGIMGRAATGGLPYPIFFYSGYLLWYFFSQSISAAAGSVVASQQLITKIYFPRLAIPIAAIGAPAIDFALAVVILIGMMLYYEVPVGWGLSLVPALLLLTALAAIGVGSLLAALNVAYRDFRHTLPFIVQIGMLATPIIYMDTAEVFRREAASERQPAIVKDDVGDVPEDVPSRQAKLKRLMPWLNLNPLMGLVGSFRAALLGTAIPWGNLLYSTSATLGLFFFGTLYFRRVERTFADVI